MESEKVGNFFAVKPGSAGVPTRFARTFVVWTAIMALGGLWELSADRESTMERARIEAFTVIAKDLSVRRWITAHGGVYVPMTRETPQNDNLAGADRDATTGQGKRLTLMNPAYAMRQLLSSVARGGSDGFDSKLAALDPKHPGNKADEWEASAIRAIGESWDNGAGGERALERWEAFGFGDSKRLRAMRGLSRKPGA